MGASFPPGILRSMLARTRIAAGQLRSYRPYLPNYAQLSAAVYTLSGQWGLESDYDMVRLVFNNWHNTAYTIQGALVAPSSTKGDRANPVNAAGTADATLFRTVYFNNNGANLRPDQQTTWGSGTTTATVPANAGNVLQPTHFFSDWVRVPSLARTDGGATTLLITRILTDAAGTHLTQNLGGFTAPWDTACQGRYSADGYATGDYVTVNQATMPTNNLLSGHLSPHGIEYYGRSSGITMLSVGDSLTQGWGGSTLNNSWNIRSAFALSSAGFPISCCNYGWAGLQSPDYLANFYNGFNALSPEIVTFPVWTPNDGFTQDTADAGFSRAMEAASYAVKHGSIMILFGPTPWGSITTGAQETARLSARTRMLEAANGYNTFAMDVESLGTGASPNRLNPAYVSSTQANHYNDAGYDAVDQQVLRPILRGILGV